MSSHKCEYLNVPITYVNLNDLKITSRCVSSIGGDKNDGIFAQSPIPIVTRECMRLPPPIHICFCRHFAMKNTTVKVENNGLTAMFTFPELRNQPLLKGGPLKDEFRFEQLHFHWSDFDDDGSEHSINGIKYACEAHLVHYNSKYESFDVAKDEKDGLLVIGIMMEACEEDNVKLDPLINALYRIPQRSSEYVFNSLSFFDWMDDVDFNEFATYNGSLTTDPFNETVHWIVLTNPINISRTQMIAFRNLQVFDGKRRIKCNARALQIPPADLKVRYTGQLKIKSRL